MTLEERYQQSAADIHSDISYHLPYFREVARGNVIEIGTYQGASTSAFILAVQEKGGHVWSIDRDQYDEAMALACPEWTFLHMNSLDPDETLPLLPSSADVLFIDGSHEYEDVKEDLANYGGLVKPGGIILMHDICPPDTSIFGGGVYFEGVRRAFDEFVVEHKSNFCVHYPYFGLGIIHI